MSRFTPTIDATDASVPTDPATDVAPDQEPTTDQEATMTDTTTDQGDATDAPATDPTTDQEATMTDTTPDQGDATTDAPDQEPTAAQTRQAAIDAASASWRDLVGLSNIDVDSIRETARLFHAIPRKGSTAALDSAFAVSVRTDPAQAMVYVTTRDAVSTAIAALDAKTPRAVKVADPADLRAAAILASARAAYVVICMRAALDLTDIPAMPTDATPEEQIDAIATLDLTTALDAVRDRVARLAVGSRKAATTSGDRDPFEQDGATFTHTDRDGTVHTMTAQRGSVRVDGSGEAVWSADAAGDIYRWTVDGSQEVFTSPSAAATFCANGSRRNGLIYWRAATTDANDS